MPRKEPEFEVVLMLNGKPLEGPYNPPERAIRYLGSYLADRYRRELSEQREKQKAVAP